MGPDLRRASIGQVRRRFVRSVGGTEDARCRPRARRCADFASQRSEVLLELASCTVAAAALWIVAGRLDGALPELKALFVALLVAFGVGVQNLVPHADPRARVPLPALHDAVPRGRRSRAAAPR